MKKDSSITIRRLSEETKSKLKSRAFRRGRSLESEVRAILSQAANEDEARPAPEPFPDWFIAMTRPGADLTEALEENRRPHDGIDL